MHPWVTVAQTYSFLARVPPFSLPPFHGHLGAWPICHGRPLSCQRTMNDLILLDRDSNWIRDCRISILTGGNLRPWPFFFLGTSPCPIHSNPSYSDPCPVPLLSHMYSVLKMNETVINLGKPCCQRSGGQFGLLAKCLYDPLRIIRIVPHCSSITIN